jgi:hypothetical protein
VLPNALPIDAPSESLHSDAFSAMTLCSFAGADDFRSFATGADSLAPGSEGTVEFGSADRDRSDAIDLETARARFVLGAEFVHRFPRSRGEDAFVLRDDDILGEERFSFTNARRSRACAAGDARAAAGRTLGVGRATIVIHGEWSIPGRHVVAARSRVTVRDEPNAAWRCFQLMTTAFPDVNGRQYPLCEQPGAVWSPHNAGEPASRPRRCTECQGSDERQDCTAGWATRLRAIRRKRQLPPKEETGTPRRSIVRGVKR